MKLCKDCTTPCDLKDVKGIDRCVQGSAPLLNACIGKCGDCMAWSKNLTGWLGFGICFSDKFDAHKIRCATDILITDELRTTGKDFGCIHWEGE